MSRIRTSATDVARFLDSGAAPLYVRVDLVRGADDAPVVLEIEMTEPSVFLPHATGAAERFARAILAAADGDAAGAVRP